MAGVSGTLLGLALVYIAMNSYAQVSASPEQKWRDRARASADSVGPARKLIVESIYAHEMVPVMQGYKEAFEEKPDDHIRLANFAHAWITASRYCSRSEDKIVNDPAAFDVMYRSLSHLVKPGPAVTGSTPPIVQHNEADNQVSPADFKPTRIADIWFDWAHFTEGTDAQQRVYQHVLELDPTFGEAYYQRASLERVVLTPSGPKEWRPETARSLRDLQNAERYEPSLHVLCLKSRQYFEATSGKKDQAVADEREYLRLWPDAPGAERERKYLTEYDESKKKS
jgi:hypothetical protein